MSTEPLAELSALLGVEVADVRDQRTAVADAARGHRWTTRPGWWLLVRPDGRVHGLLHSSWFRNTGELNRRALGYGRDPALPPLTSGDGRRALRLMHDHIESKTQIRKVNQ